MVMDIIRCTLHIIIMHQPVEWTGMHIQLSVHTYIARAGALHALFSLCPREQYPIFHSFPPAVLILLVATALISLLTYIECGCLEYWFRCNPWCINYEAKERRGAKMAYSIVGLRRSYSSISRSRY